LASKEQESAKTHVPLVIIAISPQSNAKSAQLAAVNAMVRTAQAALLALSLFQSMPFAIKYAAFLYLTSSTENVSPVAQQERSCSMILSPASVATQSVLNALK
jgi:hypothetical protein